MTPARGQTPRSPGKESRCRRTLIALTKEKKKKQQEAEMSKEHRSGCRQSYLREGGRGAVEGPLRGFDKAPPARLCLTYLPEPLLLPSNSGVTGRLRPAGGRSAIRSAHPPRGGEGSRDSVIFRFPLGSLAESPPGPWLEPGALELPPPPEPLVRLSPAVAPLLPTPMAPPPAPPRRDRPLAPTADITARILSRSRSLQRERIPSGISVCSVVSRPSIRRITVFASSSP